MVEHLLGNFCVNAGILTEADLIRVTEQQDQQRMKIGVLAVMEGYMTSEQTRKVHFIQSMMDKRFGEIAIENGYLNEEQVEELLEKQGNEYLAFVQRLIDENLFSIEEADAIVAGFQIENGFEAEQIESLKKADIDSIVRMYLPAGAAGFEKLAIMAVKAVIRLIDRHAYIGPAFMTDSYDAAAPVTQMVCGEYTFTTGIADISGGMCRAAELFGHAEFSELDADVQDACGEFLNCINGLYVSGESREDNNFDLQPPVFLESQILHSDATMVLPIFINDQAFAFMVTEGTWNAD